MAFSVYFRRNIIMKYHSALVTLAQSILILEILKFSDFTFLKKKVFCGGKMKIFF